MSKHKSLKPPREERSKQHPGQAYASARKKGIRNGTVARKGFAGWDKMPMDERCAMQSWRYQ